MFRRLPDLKRRPVVFSFEGEEVEALEGDTVAAFATHIDEAELAAESSCGACFAA